MELAERLVVQKRKPNNNHRPGIIFPDQTLELLDFCRQKSESDQLDGRSTWVQRYLLVHLAFGTGLRVSEISDLRVDHLRLMFTQPYLTVNHPRRGRRVYLDSSLINHLHRFLHWKVMKWGREIQAEDYVLQNSKGGKYTDRALEFSFKKAILEGGLDPKYSIHSARHSYAALLLSLTRNLELVMRQLGHSSHRITSVYLDILPETEYGLIEKILEVPQAWKL